MSLVAGTRLGPYEVLAAIGAGGMGEVYRAHDTQLKRDVALKVLPADVALDPDRLARFQREAELLAALNHPHIAQIYGLAEAGGVRALVMELVEGETLAARIARGPVPLDAALPLAEQIAEALEFAHERGIIHRDLKPANIKLTADGAVKVLDFGLAKALTGDVPGSGPDLFGNSPTMTSPTMSRVGVILGTAAYMAPEQARGAAVDKRADIWAFGVVLFEMLTGRVCFGGETVTDVLAAVMRADPDWAQLPAETPPRVRELLERCLVKDRRQRLHDMGDARLELENVLATASGTPIAGLAAEAKPRVSRRERWSWALTAASLLTLAIVAAVVFSGLWPRPPVVARPVVRFPVPIPQGVRIPVRPNIASISPDASTVAFVGESDRKTALWVWRLDEKDPWRVPASEGVVAAPFWKPDGREMAFAVPGVLKAFDITSRADRVLCPLVETGDPNVSGAWSAKGAIVFGVAGSSPAVTGRLYRVSAFSGAPEELIQRKGYELWPQFLENGRLLTNTTASDDANPLGELRLSTVDAAAPAARAASPAYGYVACADGYLVYGRADTLVARPLDEADFRVGTEESVVTSGVQYERLWGSHLPAFSLSQNGVLLYRAGSQKLGQFSVVTRQGAVIGDVGEPAEYKTFALSDDGATIVADRGEDERTGLWKIDTVTGILTRLTTAKQWEGDPSLGREGFVTFSSLGMSQRAVEEIPLAGGERRQIAPPGGHLLFQDRSRDGNWLLVVPETDSRVLRALNLNDGSRAVDIVTDGRQVDEARFSPDGRSVAYDSTEEGRFEVYVVPMLPTGAKQKVSTAGGVQPRWGRDGRELYYLALDGTMMAVVMNCPAGAACKAGVPRALFQSGIAAPSPNVEDYANTADGQRFVILKAVGEAGPLTVLLNWPELIRKN